MESKSRTLPVDEDHNTHDAIKKQKMIDMPKSISFEDWYKDLQRTSSKVLDIRLHPTPTSFAVHIPPHDLPNRLFELPPRQVPLFLWVDDETTNLLDVLYILQGTARKQKPWIIEAILRGDLDQKAWSVPKTLPRLWEPDSMVENILLPLLKESSNALEVWDLGAGVGRDVVFLAETLRDRTIVAMDQRYVKQALPFLEFCQRRQVSQWTCCRAVRLDPISEFQSILEESWDKVGCFYAVRFWNKVLFRCILDAAPVLQNGTILAISHFGKATPDSDWPHIHPNSKQVLDRYELRDMVQGTAWKICCDRVVTDSDHGRTLIQFVAQLQKT
ncbi:hypothetical protein FisN_7Lh192 [Fistulifera solaris]|uniref:Methyltransferase domain-containing protein n=1 Tax=Fistulifera solaris TaxID=1519565 RepID=A0A1Z5JCT4_FISSO|nr:hypothetical protein FisN_7Lh192 [Fistulifera solaris]|eukprot:GAX11807.1 hypothetical protein FisN_7Lh192 [Fistulifera solaris]